MNKDELLNKACEIAGKHIDLIYDIHSALYRLHLSELDTEINLGIIEMVVRDHGISYMDAVGLIIWASRDPQDMVHKLTVDSCQYEYSNDAQSQH